MLHRGGGLFAGIVGRYYDTIESKYRDTHFRRYRWGDDTFWYRDTRKYRDTAAILTK